MELKTKTKANPLQQLEMGKNYALANGPLKIASAKRLITQKYCGKSYAHKLMPDGSRKVVQAYYLNFRGKQYQDCDVLPGWEQYTETDFLNLNNQLT